MTRYLGLDVGASHTRVVLGDGDGRILASGSRPTPRTSSGAVADAIRELIEGVCTDAGVDPGDVVAAGIASLGPLDRVEGAVTAPTNLPQDRLPVVGPVDDCLEGDIYLHNDATAAAIGERFFRERDRPNLVFLTVSTGVGAGAIVDGHPLVGASGNAAEAGHFVLDPSGPELCGCGGAGHWEGYASGRNLPDYARHLAATADIETDLALEDLDAETLYTASDPLAAVVRDRAAACHARGIATLIHAYDPALVAVGGTVAVENPADVVDAARDRLPTLVTGEPPRIERTILGADAGVKGALACALTGGTGGR